MRTWGALCDCKVCHLSKHVWPREWERWFHSVLPCWWGNVPSGRGLPAVSIFCFLSLLMWSCYYWGQKSGPILSPVSCGSRSFHRLLICVSLEGLALQVIQIQIYFSLFPGTCTAPWRSGPEAIALSGWDAGSSPAHSSVPATKFFW